MYIHKVISKKDPLYHCEAANEARRLEWNKILEFNALDIDKPIEKADCEALGIVCVFGPLKN